MILLMSNAMTVSNIKCWVSTPESLAQAGRGVEVEKNANPPATLTTRRTSGTNAGSLGKSFMDVTPEFIAKV